jgi:hypothetical protein
MWHGVSASVAAEDAQALAGEQCVEHAQEALTVVV